MPSQFHFYTKYSKEKIKLADKPLASGGEGALFHIASPRNYGHLVAKIYAPGKRTQEREEKMTYLVNNPPLDKKDMPYLSATWVVDLLYKDKQFIGILIPFRKGYKLTQLCLAKLPRKIRQHTTWQRFAFNQPEALKLRLKTCFNIATALYQLHQSDRYVLVDLKPDNILIQDNGLVSIVDVDSVEVVEHGKLLFPAPVATPEYTPPEHYHNKRTIIQESWDRFSLGVIFYQLLLGLHPFAASAKPPYDNLVGLDDKIKYGLYVHHSQQQDVFNIIPPPHAGIKDLPHNIQELFHYCFEFGHNDPEKRPTATDWCIVLANELNLNIPSLFDRKLSIKPSFLELPIDTIAAPKPVLSFPRVITPKPLPDLKIPIPVDLTEYIQAEENTINLVHNRLIREALARLEKRKERAHQKTASRSSKEKKEAENDAIIQKLSLTTIVFFCIILIVMTLATQSIVPLLCFMGCMLAIIAKISLVTIRGITFKEKKSVAKKIKKTVLPPPIKIDKERLVKTLYFTDYKTFQHQCKHGEIELNDLKINIISLKKQLDKRFRYARQEHEKVTAKLDNLKQKSALDQATIDKNINTLNSINQNFSTLQREEVQAIITAINSISTLPKYQAYQANTYAKLTQVLKRKKRLLNQSLKNPQHHLVTLNKHYLEYCQQLLQQYQQQQLDFSNEHKNSLNIYAKAVNNIKKNIDQDIVDIRNYNTVVSHDDILINTLPKLLKMKQKVLDLVYEENKRRLTLQLTPKQLEIIKPLKKATALFQINSPKSTHQAPKASDQSLVVSCHKLIQTVHKDISKLNKRFNTLIKQPAPQTKKHKGYYSNFILPLHIAIQSRLDQINRLLSSVQQMHIQLWSSGLKEASENPLWLKINQNKIQYLDAYEFVANPTKFIQEHQKKQEYKIQNNKAILQTKLDTAIQEQKAIHLQNITTEQNKVIQQNIVTAQEIQQIEMLLEELAQHSRTIEATTRQTFEERYQALFVQQKETLQQLESHKQIVEQYNTLTHELNDYDKYHQKLLRSLDDYNDTLKEQKKKAIAFSKLQTFVAWLEKQETASTDKISIEELTKTKLETLIKIPLPSSERSD